MYADLVGNPVQPFLKTVKQGAIIRLGSAVDGKTVALGPAADALCLGKKGTDLISEYAQDLIPEFPSVEVVDGVKLLNVQDNGVQLQILVITEEPLGIFKEKAAGVEKRQPVMFGC